MSLSDRLRALEQNDRQQQQEIEALKAQLGALLDALAQEDAEDQEPPAMTLDGDQAGGERDQSEPL